MATHAGNILTRVHILCQEHWFSNFGERLFKYSSELANKARSKMPHLERFLESLASRSTRPNNRRKVGGEEHHVFFHTAGTKAAMIQYMMFDLMIELGQLFGSRHDGLFSLISATHAYSKLLLKPAMHEIIDKTSAEKDDLYTQAKHVGLCFERIFGPKRSATSVYRLLDIAVLRSRFGLEAIADLYLDEFWTEMGLNEAKNNKK